MDALIIETKVDRYNLTELKPEIQALIKQAKEQVEKAYAPYSEFKVGAAVLLENGVIFAGSNQENAAYPSGLCAERVAMFYANSQFPDVAVRAIAIAAFNDDAFVASPITPCGSCRQSMLESETRFNNKIDVYMHGTECVYHVESIAQLLPLRFEKSSLE